MMLYVVRCVAGEGMRLVLAGTGWRSSRARSGDAGVWGSGTHDKDMFKHDSRGVFLDLLDMLPQSLCRSLPEH
jgi:hypothetical protein